MYNKDNIYKKIACEIVEEMPNLNEYICTCGIGPTGIIHAGKAFDLFCTYFVSREINNLGKKSKVICIIDDCIPTKISPDREDKVPLYYLSSINNNDPNNIVGSPIDKLINEIRAFNIDIQFVYASDLYVNHKYDNYLKIVYDSANDIYKTILMHDSCSTSLDLSQIFYAYCPHCHTLLSEFFPTGNYCYKYSCVCGNSEETSILSGHTMIKWKIENAFRWHHFSTVFEPAAFNHGEVNGSFAIAHNIYKRFFPCEVSPKHIFYPFVCDSTGHKFSIRHKRGFTLSDMLDRFYPDQILYYFSSIPLDRQIKLDLNTMYSTLYSKAIWERTQPLLISNNNIYNLHYKQIERLFAIAKFYFYDVDCICHLLDLPIDYNDLRLFMEKIRHANSVFICSFNDQKPQFFSTLISLLKNNTIDFNDEKLIFEYIKNFVSLIPNYDIKQFCVDFYNCFYGCNTGPSIAIILSHCRHIIEDLIYSNQKIEYTACIIKPEALSKQKEITEIFQTNGLTIEQCFHDIFHPDLFELVYSAQDPTIKFQGQQRLINKPISILILSGYQARSICYYLCGTNGNPKLCSHESIRYKFGYSIEHETYFCNVIHRVTLDESPDQLLAWCFAQYLYKPIMSDIQNVINNPNNQSRIVNHIAPVVNNVEMLSKFYLPQKNKLNIYYLLVAAWLHDICKCYINNEKPIYDENHAYACAQWCDLFLKEKNVSQYYIDIISNCILNHSVPPSLDSSLETRILAAADGMAHIDHPWIILCNIIKRTQASYDDIKLDFFNKKLKKSLSKITFTSEYDIYLHKIQSLFDLLN